MLDGNIVINNVDIRIILLGTKSHVGTLSLLKESVWRSDSRLHDVQWDSYKGQYVNFYGIMWTISIHHWASIDTLDQHLIWDSVDISVDSEGSIRGYWLTASEPQMPLVHIFRFIYDIWRLFSFQEPFCCLTDLSISLLSQHFNYNCYTIPFCRNIRGNVVLGAMERFITIVLLVTSVEGNNVYICIYYETNKIDQ